MGKDENKLPEQSREEPAHSTKEIPDIDNAPNQKDEDSQEEKTDVESLRKVIKLTPDSDKPTEGIKEPSSEVEQTKREETTEKEELEQKRTTLQNMKDFDFQLKKNQQDIETINTKLEGLSKDLDDLVSLYEIVSEQMNPFVGLSKVTKKRLDALENFTKEIDIVKTRLGDIESFMVQAGVQLEHQAQTELPMTTMSGALSENDLDEVIEKALTALSVDQKIDSAIDGFIENLKVGDIN
ncbi:MAG: hypothetical protein JW771_07185 [Candidatus Thermoplasmatota archaeon]|nr:hypothetical protein [Candidatus Thermoplasmatota archaeon]